MFQSFSFLLADVRMFVFVVKLLRRFYWRAGGLARELLCLLLASF
jgi:hypothetical protein